MHPNQTRLRENCLETNFEAYSTKNRKLVIQPRPVSDVTVDLRKR